MNHSRRPTAVVTGASRGIGKAVAIALAAAGFDVAVTARTVREGDGRNPADDAPLAGSLQTTTAAIQAAGAHAVPVVLDLLDVDGIPAAWDIAVDGLGGRVDLLVNNAIYAGPGNDVRLADVDPADVVRRVTGNVTAQILLTRLAIRHMVVQPADSPLGARRRGTLLNVTSAAGQMTPRQPVGHGGWPLTYAATKAGFHRIADMVAVEYGSDGVFALNVNPGYVATERVLANPSLAFVAERGLRPAQVGAAMVRILADPSIANGAYLQATDYLDH